jgi:hypothetical protein
MSPSPLWVGIGVGGTNAVIGLHFTPAAMIGCLRGWHQSTCRRPAHSPHPCPHPIEGRGTLWLSPRVAIRVECFAKARFVADTRDMTRIMWKPL